ncbi:cation:proton antiporter domain-containing protein [Vibrio mangrovi]|uniref:Cation:proton antiporter n=1 Tax=Vibrio mangrovi TaxID=474394 RepID=A0A1Y6IWD7_9VIBR|nr:cation:proton antiporter [Vibrio mangrovi]MDW6002475.1 cation:proton antiporter [Vibrio mangrovi]SMS01995.1 Na(+)/H(+) antiporter NhaG [Vibrio mangrovi]
MASTGVLILIFVILSLLAGAFIKSLAKVLRFPYSVILLLIGLLVGLLSRTDFALLSYPQLNQSLMTLSEINPHLILLLFLPTLIFESAFGMETHLFKRMFSQIALLAVPGMLLASALTAVLAHYSFPWNWSWTVCFLFGALISATDPVAVVSLLKEVSSRKRLETLIEGESLLNDGTAIVLFTLFYGMLTLSGHTDTGLLAVSSQFLIVVLLGFAVGVAVGSVILFWISRLFNQPLVEITLTISAAYIAYFIAENLFHVSGVVAVVALGLMLASFGRTRISPEIADFLHHFWHMMAHIANTIIFVLVGIIIATRIRLDVPDWWISLLVLYLGIQSTRALAIAALMPLLKRIGIGINREKAIVLVWGGLRGAVSLALALIISQDTFIDPELGDQILFLTAGVVVLTIVINSTTMNWILSQLGLDRLPPAKQASLDKAKYTIKQQMLEELRRLQNNTFLHRANWIALRQPIDEIQKPKEISLSDGVKEEDLKIAFYRRLLESERQFYWSQFKHGALTGPATAQLVNAVEIALDGNPELAPRHSLFQFWKTPPYVRFFRKIPVFRHLVIHFAFERLALSYDTARGFIQAQEEVARHIHDLAPSVLDAQEALKDIELNTSQTKTHIDALREYFPDLSYSLETHAAHRLLLNLERAHLQTLIDEGMLDDSEAQKLTHEVEYKLAHLKRQPHHVSSGEISDQLRQMPWAAHIKDKSLIALGKIAQRQIFNEGELIYAQNQHATALAVIIRGRIGIFSLKGERVAEPGTLIGCCAFLTDTYRTNAKAITPSELIWLNLPQLKIIASKDKQLEEVLAEELNKEVHKK